MGKIYITNSPPLQFNADHDEFYRVATAYSFAHATMNDTAKACPRWGVFDDGVTNGADWYPVEGGMQDFNYLYAGTMEVTVEVSCCKFAHKSRLLQEWENNRESLLTFVEQVHTGIKGFVREAGSGGPPPKGTVVRVRRAAGETSAAEEDWRSVPARADGRGAYWKILNDGWYDVQAVVVSHRVNSRSRQPVRIESRESRIQRVRVRNRAGGEAMRVDLELLAKGDPVS